MPFVIIQLFFSLFCPICFFNIYISGAIFLFQVTTSLSPLKGSVCHFFCILVYSPFLAYLKAICLTREKICERLKFLVFITGETASTNLNEEEHGQSENEVFEVLESVILLH